MSVRRDLTQDLFKMLDELRTEIERPGVFMGIALGYSKDDLREKVDKIRASVPREFRDAASLAREADRILVDAKQESEIMMAEAQQHALRIVEDARAEAERTIEQARLQRDQMTSDHEVLRVASHQSIEMKQMVERECRELRRDADRYAHDTLTRLEGEVGRILATVERGRKAIGADTVAVVDIDRDRVKN